KRPRNIKIKPITHKGFTKRTKMLASREAKKRKIKLNQESPKNTFHKKINKKHIKIDWKKDKEKRMLLIRQKL
ncbi:MAG TPA: hypothetical protein VMV95_02160, partial [Bacillota bacterium]|nr:hypothetical protein [Bacillota bacterium]